METIDTAKLSEPDARLRIQELIDHEKLKAHILFDNNRVWSMTLIIKNLRQLIEHGTLYDEEKPEFIPVGSILKIPAIGDTLLSKYFYEFLTLECGSIAHYDIKGWVATYPTVEDLKKFFQKNEHGKRVLEWIPERFADMKNIVTKIERTLAIDGYSILRDYTKRKFK